MTDEQKKEITTISKEFSKPFGEINGSGWYIVDPLSAYLSACGFKNTVKELKKSKIHPQVLIIKFKDGDQFIPAGADLKSVDNNIKNWQWL